VTSSSLKLPRKKEENLLRRMDVPNLNNTPKSLSQRN
jgi:hypothetical protein